MKLRVSSVFAETAMIDVYWTICIILYSSLHDCFQTLQIYIEIYNNATSVLHRLQRMSKTTVVLVTTRWV